MQPNPPSNLPVSSEKRQPAFFFLGITLLSLAASGFLVGRVSRQLPLPVVPPSFPFLLALPAIFGALYFHKTELAAWWKDRLPASLLQIKAAFGLQRKREVTRFEGPLLPAQQGNKTPGKALMASPGEKLPEMPLREGEVSTRKRPGMILPFKVERKPLPGETSLIQDAIPAAQRRSSQVLLMGSLGLILLGGWMLGNAAKSGAIAPPQPFPYYLILLAVILAVRQRWSGIPFHLVWDWPMRPTQATEKFVEVRTVLNSNGAGTMEILPGSEQSQVEPIQASRVKEDTANMNVTGLDGDNI